MDTVFGISTPTLTTVVGIMTVILVGLLLLFAVRKRILFQIGLRNIFRRPLQSLLIILSLMLSTALLTASFGLADSLASTVKATELLQVGNIDEALSQRPNTIETSSPAFTPLEAQNLASTIRSTTHVSYATGAYITGFEMIKVYDLTSRQISAENQILAVPPDFDRIWGTLMAQNGGQIRFTDLKPGEVYLGDTVATALGAKVGDHLLLFLQDKKVTLTVQNILSIDGDPDVVSNSKRQTLILPLAEFQQLANLPDQVNVFYIKNTGSGGVDDLGPNNTVEQALLKSLRKNFPFYTLQRLKENAVQVADSNGASVLNSGILASSTADVTAFVLIYLIFVMLAAERRSELGISRALGMERSHLILSFLFEGMAYSVIAGVIGALLGVGLVPLLALVPIFGSLANPNNTTSLAGVTAQVHISIAWTSLVLAFCLGLLISFLVVAFSAYRVSRVNIIAAIRNLDTQQNKQVSFLPTGSLMYAVTGCFLLLLAINEHNFITTALSLYALGEAILIIALGLFVNWLLQRRGLKRMMSERIAGSLTGAGLMIYGLVPVGSLEQLLGISNALGLASFPDDTTVYLLRALLLLAGLTCLIMYNGSLLIKGVMSIAQHFRTLVPIMRISLTYPLVHRVRTGLTVGMFALVMFVIVMGNMTTAARAQGLLVRDNSWPVTSDSLGLPSDLETQIRSDPQLTREVGEVAWQNTQFVSVSTVVNGKHYTNMTMLRSLNTTFFEQSHFTLQARAQGYSSDQQVWDAVQHQPDLAILSMSAFSTGIKQDVRSFQAFDASVPDGQGAVHSVHVIGILSIMVGWPGLYVSLDTGETLFPGSTLSPTFYLFRPAPGVSAQQMRFDLGAKFGLTYGMEAEYVDTKPLVALAYDAAGTQFATGFVELGLIIGIIALGVISSRTVVERRQVIGMLRALGYSRPLIVLSLLIEFSAISLLGLLSGTAVGIITGHAFSDVLFPSNLGAWIVPVGLIVATLLIAYLATVLITAIAARAAAHVRPADALRYE